MKTPVKILVLLFVPCVLFGQTISRLKTGTIVELECVQVPSTGTLIAASMQRYADFRTSVLIHRSTDQGQNWVLIDSVAARAGDSEIPDPVLTIDAAGTAYLVVMRVLSGATPTALTADLECYRSSDDGQSWQLTGLPHQKDGIADYPQVLATAPGELMVSYSKITGFPLLEHAALLLRHSQDGGTSWSEAIWPADSLSSIGADIVNGPNETLLLTTGDRDSALVHAFLSADTGQNWQKAHAFVLPEGEANHITKPVAHPELPHYGLISHRAHQENTPLLYHAVTTQGIQKTTEFAQGAYAQGILTDDGRIHIIFNTKREDNFALVYIVSADEGITFSEPLLLYTAPYSGSGLGEYQSLLQAKNGLFYLTFCDWADNSAAKMLVFSPAISTDVQKRNLVRAIQVYPNPVADRLRVDFSKGNVPNHLQLTDLGGRVRKSYSLQETTTTFELDISNLESGLYLLQASAFGQIFIEKIIKK